MHLSFIPSDLSFSITPHITVTHTIQSCQQLNHLQGVHTRQGEPALERHNLLHHHHPLLHDTLHVVILPLRVQHHPSLRIWKCYSTYRMSLVSLLCVRNAWCQVCKNESVEVWWVMGWFTFMGEGRDIRPFQSMCGIMYTHTCAEGMISSIGCLSSRWHHITLWRDVTIPSTGYLRVAAMLASFWYGVQAKTRFEYTILPYFLGFVLDAVDGYAARALKQGR